MNDFILPQASLFLGIIPALIILYIGLKGYEGHYKDKTIFLTFLIGIGLGFAAAFVQSYTAPAVLIYVILLALFDQLLKTIVLNIGRLQGKKETVIYGFSLGLGFGSAITLFLLIAVSKLITSDLYVLGSIAIVAIGIIFFHGATGTLIGYGAYIGNLIKYLTTAIVAQLPFDFMIGLIIINSNSKSLNMQFGLAITVIMYGAIIFWYVNKKIMPQILSQNQRRKRRKK